MAQLGTLLTVSCCCIFNVVDRFRLLTFLFILVTFRYRVQRTNYLQECSKACSRQGELNYCTPFSLYTTTHFEKLSFPSKLNIWCNQDGPSPFALEGTPSVISTEQLMQFLRDLANSD
jgi:hypothetical protein